MDFPCRARSRLQIWSRDLGSVVLLQVSPLVLHIYPRIGYGSWLGNVTPPYHVPLRSISEPSCAIESVLNSSGHATQFRADGVVYHHGSCQNKTGCFPQVIALLTDAAFSGNPIKLPLISPIHTVRGCEDYCSYHALVWRKVLIKSRG